MKFLEKGARLWLVRAFYFLVLTLSSVLFYMKGMWWYALFIWGLYLALEYRMWKRRRGFLKAMSPDGL